MQKTFAIVFALFLMAAAGFAQIPTAGNVYLGYSYVHGDTGDSYTGNLNGWDAQLEGKVLPHIGIVADVGTQYGTLQLPTVFGSIDSSSRVTTYLFGPRVSASFGKVRPFAHVLFGGAHLHENTDLFSYSETDFADAIGGGIDYHLIPRVSWRVQVDALQTRFFGFRQDDARFTTGLALRF